MKCPSCKRDNDSIYPVKTCRCGYDSFATEKTQRSKPRQLRGAVGAELKKLIPSMFEKHGCGCSDYADKMDVWGIDGCQERHEEIVSHLVDQAKKTAIGRVSKTIDKLVATRWLNKAIENARKKVESKKA